MRIPTRYEKEVAEIVHDKQRGNFDWPFRSYVDFQNRICESSKLTGQQFMVVWQEEEKVFTREFDCVSEMTDVPHSCLVITRQEIEARFYDRHTNEWIGEEYS